MNYRDGGDPIVNRDEENKNIEWFHLHEVIKAIHESVQVAEELNEASSGPHFGIDELTIDFTAELDVRSEKDVPSDETTKKKHGKSKSSKHLSLIRFHKAKPDDKDSDDVKEKLLTKIRIKYGRKIKVNLDPKSEV